MPYTSREAIEMRKNSKCVRVYLRRKKKCERAKIEFFVCLSTLIKYKKFSSSFFFIHKYPLSLSNKFKYCRWVKYKNQQIRSLSYIYIYLFCDRTFISAVGFQQVFVSFIIALVNYSLFLTKQISLSFLTFPRTHTYIYIYIFIQNAYGYVFFFWHKYKLKNAVPNI